MTTQVPFAVMTRAEINNLALRQQGLLKDLKEAILANTREDSRLRRQMTECFDRFNAPLARTFGRLEALAVEQKQQERKVQVNQMYWTSLEADTDGDVRGRNRPGLGETAHSQDDGEAEDPRVRDLQQAGRGA